MKQDWCQHCGLRIFLSTLAGWVHYDTSKADCRLTAEPRRGS